MTMVRTYKKKGVRGLWAEEDMQRAVDAVREGQPLKTVAREYHVPRNTLRRHAGKDAPVRVTKRLGRKPVLGCFEEGKIFGIFNTIKLIDMPNKDQYVHRLVLVLEYVEGGTLASHLRFLRKLPERMLLFPMKQMADAFEYLHSRNIVHRHIKSHYVLFSNKGTVKVGHFTSAKPFIHGKKFHDNRRRFGDTAPEITQAHGYEGPPVDVWALGILFTELFGGLCFDGRNIIEGFLYGEPSRGCYAHCSCRAAANRTQDPSQISLS
uniref:serine/threonine-protein kinase MARK2-like isoform X2 n=1 Tax=Myxine glutinosa TaxID=7769 RepID=UPI00358E80BD